MTYRDQAFVTTAGEPSTDQLSEYFERVGIDFSEGIPRWLSNRSQLSRARLVDAGREAKLKRGYVLTIDYGYTAERYYSLGSCEKVRYSATTAIAITAILLSILGSRILPRMWTLQRWKRKANELGLQNLGFTQQGLFLMALGLGDRLQKLSAPTDPTQLATGQTIQKMMMRREALAAAHQPHGSW